MTSGGKYNIFRMKDKPIWKKGCSLFSPSLLFLQGTHLFFVQLFSFPPLHCLFPIHSCALQRVCCCRIPRSSSKSHACHSPGPCWSHKLLWYGYLVTRCPVWLGQRSARASSLPLLSPVLSVLLWDSAQQFSLPFSTPGKSNSTSPHPSKCTLFSEMKFRSVEQTASENQQVCISPNLLIRLQRFLTSA